MVVFQISDLRSMTNVKHFIYRDGYVFVSERGSIEFVITSASKFHDMELEISRLKNEIKSGVGYQVV